jgi:hypothetical protein
MPIAANETIIKAKAFGKFGIMGWGGRVQVSNVQTFENRC